MNTHPSVNFKDIIKDVSDRLQWMENSYPAKVTRGEIKQATASRNIVIQRRLLKLLKLHNKNPQIDLYAANEGLKVKESKR